MVDTTCESFYSFKRLVYSVFDFCLDMANFCILSRQKHSSSSSNKFVICFRFDLRGEGDLSSVPLSYYLMTKLLTRAPPFKKSALES